MQLSVVQFCEYNKYMLYKTTGKVIDFGKDNFQDFIRGEKESINLTSTYLNRPMSLAPHGGSVTANHH